MPGGLTLWSQRALQPVSPSSAPPDRPPPTLSPFSSEPEIRQCVPSPNLVPTGTPVGNQYMLSHY